MGVVDNAVLGIFFSGLHLEYRSESGSIFMSISALFTFSVHLVNAADCGLESTFRPSSPPYFCIIAMPAPVRFGLVINISL
jgi:hypothetical protein